MTILTSRLWGQQPGLRIKSLLSRGPPCTAAPKPTGSLTQATVRLREYRNVIRVRKFACLSRYYVKTLYQLDLNVLLGMDIKSGWGTPPTQYCEREGLETRPSHDVFGHANCPSGRWPEPTCCRIEARGFYRANGNQ